MQIYLPEELYREVKARRLRASELLQRAIRAELKRRDLLAESDRYLADLLAEVGEPSSSEMAWADAIVSGKTRRRSKRTG